jgi:hypothetical protein
MDYQTTRTNTRVVFLCRMSRFDISRANYIKQMMAKYKLVFYNE